MLAHVGAVFSFVVLVLAVNGLHHDPLQHAVLIARQQIIPIRTPNHLDDIPACTTEVRFQFLNDFAVAAHGSVQALQVTVDDEH